MKTARLLLALILAAAALPVHAQSIETRAVLGKYDLDATSYTYSRLDPFSQSGTGRVKTVGSSATVTGFSTDTPFTNVAVGDELYFPQAGAVRYVKARASDISITVDEAIDLSATGGYAFSFRTFSEGTGATHGWFPVVGDPAIFVFVEQLNVTGGIDARWECIGSAVGSLPVEVHYKNFTVAGIGVAAATGRTGVRVGKGWGRCRVGLKIGTNDDGGDLTTNMEQITVTVEQVR